ncbi:hypothetical protein YC2023_037484 [Brassica napus]|uniref:(rape) hypothetical protein n=1 Tax=Brassica napus TaxID=3708 RepID=A0A816I5J4_BRANA|nr:unnamed protein product [Brassica napus]
MRGSRIKEHACVSDSIVGWDSTVGSWARVANITVLGKDVHVADAEWPKSYLRTQTPYARGCASILATIREDKYFCQLLG